MNELLTDIRDTFYELTNQDIPLAIIKTVESIWREDMRPVLHKKKKTAQGYDFTFALPHGMAYKEFAKFEEHFRDAIGDVTIEVIHNGKMVVLKVIIDRLKSKYIYDFDHIAHVGEMVLPIPIGYTHVGLLIEDLSEIPHILIGGITGGGKSNSIHVIVNSLLHLAKPPRIVIADLKQLEYSYLSNHVLLVTEQATVNQAITRLVIEMRNRLTLLKNAGCVNIEKYNKKHGNIDYIVLVIDELAELIDQKAQENFETLLRLCRATGICIVAATQRPDADTFKKFGQSKANFSARLCFNVADGINSKIILDNTLASDLPNIPGRAIWKLGKSVEVQTPYLDPDIAKEMLNVEQSAERCRARFSDDKNVARVGSDGRSAIAGFTIPLLQSCTKAFAKISRAKKD